MATTERPKSRLDDGRVNPAYTAWRKANKGAAVTIEESREANPEKPFNAWIQSPQTSNERPTDEALAAIVAPFFQSAAEPEQTNIDDPREPEVAPALEALSQPETAVTLLAVKLAANERFVLCQHPTEKGKTVPVRLHKKIAARLLRKPINVRIEGEGDGAKYFHAR